MDKRAAAQYLDRLFAGKTGHVAVAYKDRGQSWQECQFAWPADKSKLLGWAEVHKDANIFVCPALRKDAHTRKKGDMQPSRWLWADVDWQSVPADRVADVQGRINELSCFTVASGTGDNVHVYVELNQPVEHEQFIKLNTGLRDYLYADNKQADNSLLRLPGTTNWKTAAGAPVRENSQNAKTVAPASLMKRRAFRDAKVPVEAEATDWQMVDVAELGLSRRILRMTGMSTAEALGRYGARNQAVYAVTKELYKRGLDADQIHSLMDKFPAALDKAAEENGYDRHLDVDRCLARIKQAEDAIVEAETQNLDDQIEDEFPELSDEEAIVEAIEEGKQKELLRRAIRKAADIEEATRGFTGPPDDVSWSLTDALVAPPRPIPHLIAGRPDPSKTHVRGLAGDMHNVVVTAQYKTGKTAFVTGSLAPAICDGQDFLDTFPVNVPAGGAVLGHWNCEMDPAEMLDDYIRPVGIKNTHNLHVTNLRGYSVNILSDMGKQWAVEWLRSRNVRVWTIDSFARLARMAGVSEKDNDEVMSLLMRLDEIKVEAGCHTLFLITHTGRAEMEEGKERARGATAIDDWADARWILTKMDKTRFLRVEGRGVELDDSALIYDKDTHRSVLGFGGKAEVKDDTAKDAVVGAVKASPGITKTELIKVLKSVGISARAAAEPIEEAIEGGFIEVKRESLGRGKPAIRHSLTGSLKGEDRHMNASPQDIDLRGVRVRPSRRGG